MNKDFQLIQTNWQQYRKQLSEVRRKVFIDEQQVPEELEWDEFDDVSLHILVVDKNNRPVATGRIKPDGQIGRMAVIKNHRNKGIGSAIINALLDYAKQQSYSHIYLHAQVSASEFYKKYGFTEYGNEFMDANILHKSMKFEKTRLAEPLVS